MRSIVMLACLLLPSLAFASRGNVCAYNGDSDDRRGKPQHFTGEYSCKDMDTHKVTLIEQMVDGLRDGKFVEFEDTGVLKAEGRYRKDRYDGVVKRYQNGKLSTEFTYVDGETVGVQKQYDDGVLARVYLTSDRNHVDVDFQLNPKGQPMTLTCGKKFVSSQDAEWCGHNGKLSTVSLYTKEGELSATVQYLWGKQNGVARKYHVKTGKVIHEEQYEDGKPVEAGRKHFDKEGTLLSKTDCDPSRKKCTETSFFEDGKQAQQVTQWSNGKRARETTYYQNGKPQSDLVAEGDKYRITEYYDSGKERTRGTYVAARSWYWRPYLPDGLIEYFEGDGTLQMKENYKEGILEGRSDQFFQAEGHAVHVEADYAKDHMLKRKVSVDNTPIVESEFFPDGSIKSQKKLAPSPLKELDI